MSTRKPEVDQTDDEGSGGVLRRLHAQFRGADRSTILSIAVVGYLFAAGVAWAMITPIGGVPDEPAHITYSAGVVRGDLGGLAAVKDPVYTLLPVVAVPQWVASITDPPTSLNAYSDPCYAGGVQITADCAPRMSNSTTDTLVPTTVTRYPPPYYWIVGLPTLFMAGEPAVYAMRITSAALAAAMIAFGLAVASPSRRLWLAPAATIAFTPMVGHFAGSVNPSGLEIAAAMGLGIGLMGITGKDDRTPRRTALIVAVLALALAWSRPRTYLVLVAVLAAAALVNTDELRKWLRNGAGRLTALVGIAVALTTSFAYQQFSTEPGYLQVSTQSDATEVSTQSDAIRLFTQPDATRLSAQSEVVPTAPQPSDNMLFLPVLGLTANLHELERRFIDWGLHLMGRFGWLDHSPPASVSIGWMGLVLTLVVLAFTCGRRRDRVVLTTIGLGAVVATPLFVTSNVLNAFIYQARYHLSVATLMIIGAAVVLSRHPRGQSRIPRSVLNLGAMLAPVAMLASIGGSLHRYSIGGQSGLADVLRLPFRHHDWLPPAGALMVAGIAVALGAGAQIAAGRTGALRQMSQSGGETKM